MSRAVLERTLYLYIAEREQDAERLVGVVYTRAKTGTILKKLEEDWPDAYSWSVEPKRRA